MGESLLFYQFFRFQTSDAHNASVGIHKKCPSLHATQRDHYI